MVVAVCWVYIVCLYRMFQFGCFKDEFTSGSSMFQLLILLLAACLYRDLDACFTIYVLK